MCDCGCSERERGLQQEDPRRQGPAAQVRPRHQEGKPGEEGADEVRSSSCKQQRDATRFLLCREDKLLVEGKMYVYNDKEGRVVQHRLAGAVW